MNRTGFIDDFARHIGKPVSDFTLEDWKRTAITAAQYIDEIERPKKRGRPRKHPRPGTLWELVKTGKLTGPEIEKAPAGRPANKYGKYDFSNEEMDELLREALSSDAKPDERPKNKTDAMRHILRAIGEPAGNVFKVMRLIRNLRRGGK